MEKPEKEGRRKLRLEEKVALGILGTGAGCFILAITCAYGCWGSRGINDVYTTQYNGKPAVVQHNNIRWGPDKYWILLDNKDKIFKGIIVSDDGKEIRIGIDNDVVYSVRDYKPTRE